MKLRALSIGRSRNWPVPPRPKAARSKYERHQGPRECARRARQMIAAGYVRRDDAGVYRRDDA